MLTSVFSAQDASNNKSAKKAARIAIYASFAAACGKYILQPETNARKLLLRGSRQGVRFVRMSPMQSQPDFKAPIPAAPEVAVHVTFTRDARALYAKDQSAEDVYPEQATPYSAGCDLRACLDGGRSSITVQPGCRVKVGTGVALQIQGGGIAPLVYSRSGLGAGEGLVVAQGVGVIDPDYTGEIFVYLLNTSQKPITVGNGDRVAQIVFTPFCRPLWREVRRLEPTVRGEGGFGHTGLV